ncbi:dynein light chain roadblock-type 2 [Favolaschia claudopus]|uniref:Dynein light chain roadblock-type 2 n=1 Tax=Favolaschia claudopus TaxID=2862362 RepID=A0AAW0DDQ6_9AGAR
MMDSPTAPVRTASIPQLNGAPPPVASTSAPTGMSPELEQTLTLLSSHRAVLGYILLGRGHPVSIIRHVGVVFEGEQGKKYAAVITRIVESVQGGLEEVHGGEGDADDLRFLRIRTKRHEIMISPDDRYLLAVLYDPST